VDAPNPRHKRLDARTLRGLAHPLRTQILGLLRTEGPATATSLAARLGESTGTTSWHLRCLADYGFIEEDSARGNRRDRWWRSAHESTYIPVEELIGDPETADALAIFQHGQVSTYARNAARFVSQIQTWSRDWVEASDLSDWVLSLTPAEAKRLHREIHEVVERYRREPRPGDEQVGVQLQLFPRRRGAPA
jgi:DNA-binding transcriptional ArsR family regulator